MEGGNYEYAIFEITGDDVKIHNRITGSFYNLEPIKERLALIRSLKSSEGRVFHIEKRLVMNWEPIEEEDEE